MRTGKELPALAAEELTAKMGARDLEGAIPDHAAPETALNRLLSEWLDNDVARLGCGMHAIENPAKAALSTPDVLDSIGTRLGKLAQAENVAPAQLRPRRCLPRQTRSLASPVPPGCARRQIVTAASFVTHPGLKHSQSASFQPAHLTICSSRCTRCRDFWLNISGVHVQQ